MHWKHQIVFCVLLCDARASSFASNIPSFRIRKSSPPCSTSSSLKNTASLQQPRGGGNDDFPSEEYDSSSQSDTDFIKSVIRTSNFASKLPNDAMQDLVSCLERVQYEKGTTVFSEDDERADFLLVIESGQCRISVQNKQLPAPYGVVSRGSIVGGNALLFDTLKRESAVTAMTDITGYKLNRQDYKRFIQQLPNTQEDMQQSIQDIDFVIDKVSGTKTRYGGDVIQTFKPSRAWLWRRWTGTILQHAWKSAAINMLLAIVTVSVTEHATRPTWKFGMIPDLKNHVISRMVGLSKAWKYLMTVTTFTLTFFLSQAYGLWRDIYTTARVIQGRLSDINLLLACTAERSRDGTLTTKAKLLMEDVAAYTRLYHVFMWASLTDKLSMLLSDLGLRRMIAKGVLSQEQYNTLQELDYENVAPPNACLVWIITGCLKGMQDGVIPNDVALRQQLYEKSTQLQGVFAGVGGKLAGKIPLAYAHFVQILVDSFLVVAPFALYSELGVWCIPAVGILTLFYSGLLDLAKILLHPLGNDDGTYNESVNMDLSVIIKQSNAGSTRWMNSGKVLPF